MLKIGSIVWGVRDVERAVQFWCAALDYKLQYEAEEDWAILVPREGDGIQLSLNLVTSERPRRHHIDLFTPDQEGEVRRLIGLGATRFPWNYPPDADFVVLADTEGNTFCVVQE